MHTNSLELVETNYFLRKATTYIFYFLNKLFIFKYTQRTETTEQEVTTSSIKNQLTTFQKTNNTQANILHGNIATKQNKSSYSAEKSRTALNCPFCKDIPTAELKIKTQHNTTQALHQRLYFYTPIPTYCHILKSLF